MTRGFLLLLAVLLGCGGGDGKAAHDGDASLDASQPSADAGLDSRRPDAPDASALDARTPIESDSAVPTDARTPIETDANTPEPVTGWTEFELQPGALVIHVSNSGDDDNPGTLEAPKATLQAGYDALRNGEADWLLLERGSTWTLASEFNWAKSGPLNAGEGVMRFGAYGDESAPRPRIDSGLGTALILTPGYQATAPLAHVAVTDLHLVAQARLEAAASALDGPVGVQALAVEYQGEGAAIRDLLLENLRIEGYSGAIITYEDAQDLSIRRCILTEIFIPGGDGTRATGILAGGADLLFEENVFYRIQHPDMPGVSAISTQSHSAYISAAARNVVSRGNIIVKTTEGFMQRAGGVFEGNVSAHNEIAHLTGQAWGVTPTEGGVTATIQDNLFLNTPGNLILGNTASGTVARNLLVQGAEGTVATGIDLVAQNAQGDGLNVGVHDTRFEGNLLAGEINYDMSDATSFSGLSFADNQTAQGMSDVALADFLALHNFGEDIDDYGRALLERDRATFTAALSAEALIDFYRERLSVPVEP